ncbi:MULTISPECIES: methyltransferase domain-containing protein [unclassified Salipiger]|uniref:class I SAM-dependent methyltransferase n=1 Tax=unclassified Salipiger TaxID=2640570 RepID=UPI00080ABB02|nr:MULTISPECIES: methyltransferase domain-containing protein [unclassified Salipiger]ANT61256.1 methyltransferase [Salipiger sp. CCB-MM3]NDV99599.1 methyltransferase domain-containing protein [Salipiger sp. PrR002]NDW57245.1 methyltransferase domain-containing protein [Salipiger sp. PrR004]
MTPGAWIEKTVRDTATTVLPESLRKWVRKQQRLHKLQSVPVGSVNFGGLRRLSPISAIFGQDRDLLTIERFYIEEFLAAHSEDIRGRVLEMGDPAYIRKFGGDRVTQEDVLNYVEGNPQATIVADLTDAPQIADNTFDCIIITQTLQMIFEVDKAIATLHRILKPGGVVLCTSHGMSRVARREGVDDWGEYWHFTSQSKRRLFGAVFGRENVTVSSVGNVFTCICNLHGLGAGELDPDELAVHDPNYEMLLLVRAVKAG